MKSTPYLTDDNRDEVIARIDGLVPVRKITDELEYPVGPQYEKGEQVAQRRREKAREMPQMQLCRRMAALIGPRGVRTVAGLVALLLMVVGVQARPAEQAMPILALHTARIGAYDVQTTVTIVPSADNLEVCVGLAGEKYRARWQCRFVEESDTGSVTVTWRDVPYEDYAMEAALWRAHRLPHNGAKVSETFRRAFGVGRI